MVHPDDERYTAPGRQAVSTAALRPRRSRSSPTPTSTASSAPAASRSPPAHDFNDYAVGQRHGLPMIGDLHARREDQRQRARAPTAGLDRFEARKQVVADLEAQGLLEKAKPHQLVVPRCARTGQIVEPMLTDQWFVAMTKPGADGKSIAGKAIDAVETGAVQLRARAMGQHLQPVDEQHPGLVHLAPALVGPPDPGLVRRRTASCSSRAARTRRRPRRRPPATPAR